MNDEKLNLKIERLEVYAERHPSRYRLRLAALAALGYAYLLAIVVGLFSISIITLVYVRFNFLVIKVIWIPVVIGGLVLRSLWVTIPQPDGIEIQREQAPELFALVNETRRVLSGPAVDFVLLSTEFNASIVQIPRFGMLGWMRNYLVVGLPLLFALDSEEFQAVLAHEFGHLSGKHGRFSGWIYRVRQSWIQILTKIQQERHYATWLFEPFLNWYAPFFNAYSFVLARMQEREADMYSSDISGKLVAGRALIKLTIKDRALTEVIWPKFYEQAKEQPQPPRDSFDQILQQLAVPLGKAKSEMWFLQALRVETSYDDTHPALFDRLAGLGFDRKGLETLSETSELFKTDHESAAAHYLKQIPDGVTGSFNRLVKEGIAQSWRERHHYIKEAAEQLNELDRKALTRELSIEEEWERARLLSETRELSAALPVLEFILARTPDHVGANFAMGSILLESGEARGIEHLEKAMQFDPAITGDACELAYEFYRSSGHQQRADAYRTRAEQHYEELQKFHEQALNLTAHDHYEGPDLPAEELHQLRDEIAAVRGVAAAYLVRKVIPGANESLYVLAVVPDYRWQSGRSEKNGSAVVNELASTLSFSRSSVFIALEGQREFLQDIFAAIEGSRIYPQ